MVVAGFISFGIATFQARVYPRWTGPVMAIGSAAAIVMAPLAFVPTGPFRLDRIGVLAASFAFAWCGWHLLRHPAAASSDPGDKTASSTACTEGLAGSASATRGHDARLPRP